MCKRNMIFKTLLGAVLLVLTLQAARSENYAFLVGVSDYQSLPSKCSKGEACDLRGPKNDISAMWNVLVANGFARTNMIVLADHLQDALKTDITANGLPTRTQIMTRLEKLAQKVKRGDFVYLHFSGHGAMQPDLNGDETDGLDEIFLPIDIGKWDEETQAVKNAIVDDELAVPLKLMTSKGVKVFAVFDQCNAGTVTRGTGEHGVRERALSASDLGIPPALVQKAQSRALDKRRQRGLGDKLPVNNLFSEAPDIVSFYAVHPGESAREQRLPKGALKSSAYISGAFSFSIARALGSNSPKSYLDLSRIIRRTYDSLGYSETPLFEGDLNRLVFGRGSVPRRLTAHFEEDDLHLDGGLLQGLAKGSTVSLYNLVIDKNKRDKDRKGGYLGEAEVVEATAVEAALEVTTGVDGQMPDLSVLPYRMWVEISSHALPLDLRVALPEKSALEKSPHADRLRAALEQLQRGEPDRKSGVVISWVRDNEQAAFRLLPDGDELRLASGVQQMGERPRDPVVSLAGAADTDSLSAEISKALQQLGKTRNILRFADMLGVDSNLADVLDIRAFIYRETAPLPAKSTDGPADNRDCEPYDEKKVLAGKVAFADVATIVAHHCDILVFELRNKSENTLDVTGVYMDRAGGISLLSGYNPVRLEPRPRGKEAKHVYQVTQIITWDTVTNRPSTIGLEHAAFIVVEHRKGEVPSELSDFRALEKDALPVSERRRNARGAGDSLLDQIKAIAFPQGKTRGNLSQTGKRSEIRLFPVQVEAEEK